MTEKQELLNQEELLMKIEDLREKLNKTENENKRLELSQELDRLIVKAMKENIWEK